MIITRNISEIVSIYNIGGIFAYPTESVFGLGCNPDDETAVNKILTIKQRPASKGLILIASNFSQVEKYLKPLSESQKQFTKPSEITYVYPALSSAPTWLTGNYNSLAVRITDHPIAKKLCESLDSALVSTSANPSGKPPATHINDVLEQLGQRLDAILDGELGKLPKPSEIRDSISGEKIR